MYVVGKGVWSMPSWKRHFFRLRTRVDQSENLSSFLTRRSGTRSLAIACGQCPGQAALPVDLGLSDYLRDHQEATLVVRSANAPSCADGQSLLTKRTFELIRDRGRSRANRDAKRQDKPTSRLRSSWFLFLPLVL